MIDGLHAVEAARLNYIFATLEFVCTRDAAPTQLLVKT